MTLPPPYLTVDQADLLAGTLPGLAAYRAAEADAKLAALLLASERIDAARWRGTLTSPDQPRSWPRDGRATPPLPVLLATLHEADAVLAAPDADETFARVRRAVAAGLTAQSVGSVSESYAPATSPAGGEGAGGMASREAAGLLARFRVTSGRLL